MECHMENNLCIKRIESDHNPDNTQAVSCVMKVFLPVNW